MFKIEKSQLNAREYIKDLSEKYGSVEKSSNRVVQDVSEVWNAWKDQGVSKPSSMDNIAESPMSIYQMYYDDIVANHSKIKNFNPKGTVFLLIPWGEVNACANTLLNGDRVILLDTHLVSFLNEVAMLIIVCSYSHPSETEIEFYKNYFLSLVDAYLNKSIRNVDMTEDFKKIISKDYDLTEIGAYCASAFLSFILCHEVSHHILNHSTEKREFHLLNIIGKDEAFKINSPLSEQEYEADIYGCDIFLEIVKNRDEMKIIKIPDGLEKLPMVFFEIVDLVYCVSSKNGINRYNSSTHPDPLDRKNNIEKMFSDYNEPLTNEFYDVFMEFSDSIRKALV